MTFEIVIKCSVSLLSSFSIFVFIFTYGPDFFLVFYTNMWQMFFSNILLRKKKKGCTSDKYSGRNTSFDQLATLCLMHPKRF